VSPWRGWENSCLCAEHFNVSCGAVGSGGKQSHHGQCHLCPPTQPPLLLLPQQQVRKIELVPLSSKNYLCISPNSAKVVA